MPYRLTYILDIPCKWKQICARWTCGGGNSGDGNKGSLVCCGGSDVLLEARRWGFPVERGGIGVRVRCVPRQRRQIQSAGLLSHLFLFASLFWSLLECEACKKYSRVGDLVRTMMMKRSRRWHWLVFYWCLGFLHVQCSKCLCATRLVNYQVLAWLYLSV
jgi:hypothetical protein